MNRRPPIAAALLSLAILQPAAIHAASPGNLDTLLRNSPFGVQVAPAQAGRIETPLEFRGVFVDGGESFFSLYETSSHSSRWVGLDEPGNPFTVRGYDNAKGTVTVEYQGHTLALPLKQAKVVAMSPGAAGVPVAAGPAPATGTPASVAPAGSAGDAARLAAVAEEIRRRRALRQQTAQSNPQNFPPAPERK